MIKLHSRIFTSTAIATLTMLGLSTSPSLAQLTEPIQPMDTPAEGMLTPEQMEQMHQMMSQMQQVMEQHREMMGDGAGMMNDSNHQPGRMNQPTMGQ